MNKRQRNFSVPAETDISLHSEFGLGGQQQHLPAFSVNPWIFPMHHRVRVLHMKRSPLESHKNLAMRRVIKNLGCDEHMIGEVHVNEEVEYSWPEAEATYCSPLASEKASRKFEEAPITKRFHEDASKVFNKVIKTLWVLQDDGECV